MTKDQLEQTVTLKNEVADAPITRGQEMGTLTISYNGQVCVTVPLLAQADVSASRFLVAKAAVEEFLSRTIVKVALVVLVLLVILLYLFLGTFMDAIPAIILFAPILLKSADSMGLTAVQLGIVITITLAIGQITPPYGGCLMLGSKIARMPIQKAFTAAIPYISASLLVVILLAFFPQLCTVFG